MRRPLEPTLPDLAELVAQQFEIPADYVAVGVCRHGKFVLNRKDIEVVVDAASGDGNLRAERSGPPTVALRDYYVNWLRSADRKSSVSASVRITRVNPYQEGSTAQSLNS